MGVKAFIAKVTWYQKKHGWLKLIKLFLQRIYWQFNDKSVVYTLDLKTMEINKSILRENMNVESYYKIEDIPFVDMENLIKLKNKHILMAFLKSFFERGATLWLTKEEGILVSLIWTSIGGFSSYYDGIQIFPDDVVFHAGETFLEFRGHNILAIMIWLVCKKLKEEGISRVYSATHIKNKASVRSQEKVLKRIGAVRCFNILKWQIAIWDKNQ
jgi:hypothetical protein